MQEDTDLCSVLLRALHYEHWLRFHFLDDPEQPEAAEDSRGDACPDAELRVPDEWVEISRREEPELFPVLESLRGRSLSMEDSRDAVFRHAARVMGRDAADPAFGAELFELVRDPQFRRGLDAFHGWVQELADGEQSVAASHPSGVPFFQEWERSFRAWAARQAIQRVTSITPYAAKPEGDR